MKNTIHIYTRVSSVIQQEEGTSLENQKQLGIKKAAELGFEYRLWNEGGQSSFYDDLDNRPVLVSLLAEIEAGNVKHLFVYNADRLSRNQQTWAVIRFKLLSHGVMLHTASGQMKLKNPVDDLMLGILSEISQYDNRIRAERSRMGRFQKVQQGNWKGGPPPYGYHIENKKLVVDEFESDWIRKIYDWYCFGDSVKTIQIKLNESGVVTRRGNPQWSLGSIQLILRNTVYIGYYEYTDKMIGETVRIESPVIVDPAIFETARNKRQFTNNQKNQINPTKHFYMLRGLLVCGHCGRAMAGRIHRAGHQNSYYCVAKERDWKTRLADDQKWKRGSRCSMTRSINITKTDNLVWDVVASKIKDLQQFEYLLDQNNFLLLAEFDEAEGSQIYNFPTKSESTDFYRNISIIKDILSKDKSIIPTDQDKKMILDLLVDRISVFFDPVKNKHSLNVEFKSEFSVLLKAVSEEGTALGFTLGQSEIDAETVSEGIGEVSAKKSLLIMSAHTAEQDYMVTVE